jgi:hypothetical protein
MEREMDEAYAPWVGRPVVLQVASGESKVALRGKILKDCGDALRIRVDGNWDIGVYKSLILAVEEDTRALTAA